VFVCVYIFMCVHASVYECTHTVWVTVYDVGFWGHRCVCVCVLCVYMYMCLCVYANVFVFVGMPICVCLYMCVGIFLARQEEEACMQLYLCCSKLIRFQSCCS